MITFDPSIDCTGYAYVDSRGRAVSGVIETTGKTHHERLFDLFQRAGDLIGGDEKLHIKTAIIEVPLEGFSYKKYSGSSGDSKNMESLVINGMACGVILAALRERGIEQVYEIMPTEWKGKLSKQEAMLATGKNSHDEADALLLLRRSRAEGIAGLDHVLQMRKQKKAEKRARRKPWPHK